jgi:hypothetical protein
MHIVPRRARVLATFAAALSLATLASMVPASAHTYVNIVAFQINPGGYVSGYGVAPNQKIDEGAATDGTVIWNNLDPVAHRFVGKCVAVPSATPRCTIGQRYFDVTVQPGEMHEYASHLPYGTYEYGDASYPWMQARFRVTSQE